MITKKEKIKIERSFIALLIRYKDLVSEWIEEGPQEESFDDSHKYILSAIQHAFNDDSRLTRKKYMYFLSKFNVSKLEIQAQEGLFNTLNIMPVNRDDFPLLRTQILEAHVARVGIDRISEYQEDIKSKGALFATKKLIENLNSTIVDTSEKKKIIYESVTDYADTYFADLEERAKKGDDVASVKCYIDEIDYSMNVGFAAGSLTLFCADVGCFKSTMMLNIGANIWKKANKNILYVPLEMPRDKMYQKFLSREENIPFEKLEHPTLLSDEEISRIKNFKTKLQEHEQENGSKFFIMEAPEQIPVSVIRREIEKHIDIFKPHVVVIDYIANLITDKNTYRKDRNDLEIGNMLKALRTMGKPGAVHKEGFAIVSGAQIGREALKRVRKTGAAKTSFYSEDIRGSHEYSADADNIFFQMPDPQQPGQRLHVYRVKTRYGFPFKNNSNKITLEVKPECSLIRSIDDDFYHDHQEDIMEKINDADQLDFDDSEDVKDLGDISSETFHKFDEVLGIG
ncbi:MAG: DnaB-like helicase C-terminal domain-containing protein [Atribacterota bacterium]